MLSLRDSESAGGGLLEVHHPESVLRIVAGGEERHSGEIAVVIGLIAVRGIRRELIVHVGHIAGCGAIAHRVIGDCLRRAQQGMGCAGQPIQRIVVKRLCPSSVGQTRPHKRPKIGQKGKNSDRKAGMRRDW